MPQNPRRGTSTSSGRLRVGAPPGAGEARSSTKPSGPYRPMTCEGSGPAARRTLGSRRHNDRRRRHQCRRHAATPTSMVTGHVEVSLRVGDGGERPLRGRSMHCAQHDLRRPGGPGRTADRHRSGVLGRSDVTDRSGFDPAGCEYVLVTPVVLEADPTVSRRSFVGADSVVLTERSGDRKPEQTLPALLRVPLIEVFGLFHLPSPMRHPPFVSHLQVPRVVVRRVLRRWSGLIHPRSLPRRGHRSAG